MKTRKRLLSILLCLALVLGLMPGMSLTVKAANSWNSGDCTVTYDASSKTLTVSKKSGSGNGEMRNYGYGDDPWHSYCPSVERIVIENGVTKIGNFAFYGCSKVTDVSISDTVTSIGNDAFQECSSLESITIPESVTTMGVGVFYSCTSLKSVNIPSKVTSIGDELFEKCSSLTSFNIPDHVTNIGDYAFKECTALESVTIPDSVTSFDCDSGETFYGCTALTSIEIPGVAAIPQDAFYGCTSLSSVILRDSLTSIGSNAFRECTSLSSVVLPDSLASIEISAFYGCTALTGITIPGSVTKIGRYAFCSCSKLESVTFKPGVLNTKMEVGAKAFSQTADSATINYTPDNNTMLYEGSDYGLKAGDPLTYLYSESETYDAKRTWKGALIEGQKWTNGNCTATMSGTKLTVSKTENAENGSMGTQWVAVDYAAEWSVASGYVAELQIQDSVTNIGSRAFYNCQSLTNVTIPSNIASIETNAFGRCTAMTSVTFEPGTAGDTLTIGSSAFYYTTAKLSYGAGDTVLYDGTTKIEEGTSLTDIQGKTLTWKAPHDHAFTYTANGATITATCSNHDDCPLESNDYKATLTISAPTEGGGAAVLTQEPAGSFTDLPAVCYQTKSEGSFGELSTAEPNGKGFYKASITLGEGNDAKTASVTYGVNAISLADGITNGTVDNLPEVATVNANVMINTTPDTGCELNSLTVTKTDNTKVPVLIDGNHGSFTMPDEEVTVDAVFQKIDYTIKLSDMSHGTVEVVSTAQIGDTVTLTIKPDTGFVLDSLEVKQDNSDVAVSGTGNTRTFTMPADNVTVSAVFEGQPFKLAVSDKITNGTITVKGDSVTTADGVTTAKAGTEVTLSSSPDTGYELGSVTVTTAGGESVKVSDNRFTMPADEVTVSADFVGLPVSAKLTVAGNDGTDCKASLLEDDFTAVSGSLTKKTGESFILSVTSDDDYDYSVAFDPDSEISEYVEEFSSKDYEKYIAYVQENNISVSSQTELYWVRVPGIADGKLEVTVTFGKVKPFTILYKPAEAQTSVWCKLQDSEGKNYVAELEQEVDLEEDSVWSVKVMNAFEPKKIAFGTSLEDVKNIKIASLTSCSAQTDTTWKTISDDQYMVIGGNAKTVVAAFSTEEAVNKSLSERYKEILSKIGSTVSYRITVCLTDEDGNVTTAGTVKAPGAPAKEGFTFGGWRGFAYDENAKASEKIYAANAPSIPVRENTVLSAVWDPIIPKVVLKPGNGTGSHTENATYGSPLSKPEDPAREGFAFNGWTVGKNVTESGTFFPKGSSFDFTKGITKDLELNAQWKHVHSYTCYRFSDLGDEMKDYLKYEDYFHIKICGCGDIQLEAHSGNGKCACGYPVIPKDERVTMQVSYQKWVDGSCAQTLSGGTSTEKINDQVTAYAPDVFGETYQFSKWEYSTDSGASWYELSAYALASFTITGNMQLRAIYKNPVEDPKISLSTRKYMNARMDGYDDPLSSILFQMDYELPDGCTLVDAGVRLGDNNGISYYEMKELKKTAKTKAIEVGIDFGANIIPYAGGGLGGFVWDQISGSGEDKQYYYEKREDNVLKTISAQTLSDDMYKFKPVNVEKYPPIYWETKAETKSQRGSLNVLAPVAFAQSNNGDHYIYGMSYLQYKDKSGNVKTIYTDALDPTLNGVLANKNKTAAKSGS